MIWTAFIRWVRYPRMIAWCVFTACVWGGARILFSGVCMLPVVAELMPGFVLAPLAGLYAGPAGVAGIIAGTLAADVLLGRWGAMTLFRVLAFGLAALYMMALPYPRQLNAGPRSVGQIGLQLVPVSLTAAAWIAVGGALQRLYPFAYLLGLNAAQFLIFSILFAPAVLHLLLVHWAPRFGTWQEVMGLEQHAGQASLPGQMIIWIGALAACGAGALLSGALYGVWPIGRPWLGLHTGPWVTVPVLVFLFVQMTGALVCFHGATPDDSPSDERFARIYVPPLEKR